MSEYQTLNTHKTSSVTKVLFIAVFIFLLICAGGTAVFLHLKEKRNVEQPAPTVVQSVPKPKPVDAAQTQVTANQAEPDKPVIATPEPSPAPTPAPQTQVAELPDVFVPVARLPEGFVVEEGAVLTFGNLDSPSAVFNYLQNLDIRGVSSRKILLADGNSYRVGEFIESSDTIKYVHRDDDVLVFEALGKSFKVRY